MLSFSMVVQFRHIPLTFTTLTLNMHSVSVTTYFVLVTVHSSNFTTPFVVLLRLISKDPVAKDPVEYAMW